MAFHPQVATVLAVATFHGEVVVYDYAGKRTLFKRSMSAAITSLSFHPDGSMLIFTSGSQIHSCAISVDETARKLVFSVESTELTNMLLPNMTVSLVRSVLAHPLGLGYVIAFKQLGDALQPNQFQMRIVLSQMSLAQKENATALFLVHVTNTAAHISKCGRLLAHIADENNFRGVYIRSLTQDTCCVILHRIASPNAFDCALSPCNSHVAIIHNVASYNDPTSSLTLSCLPHCVACNNRPEPQDGAQVISALDDPATMGIVTSPLRRTPPRTPGPAGTLDRVFTFTPPRVSVGSHGILFRLQTSGELVNAFAFNPMSGAGFLLASNRSLRSFQWHQVTGLSAAPALDALHTSPPLHLSSRLNPLQLRRRFRLVFP
jgi:hypothetical protein